jgi:exopolysaccharide biosynthesis WecB/TagA/CpsF family protein
MRECQGTGTMPPLQKVDQSADRANELCEFLGFRFWDISLVRAAQYLVDMAAANQKLQVFFVNAHCVNVAVRDRAYARLLETAPFLFADGFGMALAARIWGIQLANNVNGTDLFPMVCRAAADASVPIAFLGARPGVAKVCAERMTKDYPGLKVVWAEHGYHSPDLEENKLAELNASGARILFVAKGVPEQEHWISAHMDKITVPVVLGVGALFDFYSGSVPRAPRLMRDLRMEWAFRLWREPRRLFRRYVIGNPEFLVRALMRRLVG